MFVTVQPFGFPVTESAHSKSPSAGGRFFLGQIDVIVRTLQQVQSPGLNCYKFVPAQHPQTWQAQKAAQKWC